ncbi:MAG: zinc-ribbon domain-containing protein [Atopobiaceae bacterium]|nr:zinc-ribbon domain-containing protein [Atopobiaceae bacterium]
MDSTYDVLKGLVMVCHNCGAELNDDVALCPECGTEVQTWEPVEQGDVAFAYAIPEIDADEGGVVSSAPALLDLPEIDADDAGFEASIELASSFAEDSGVVEPAVDRAALRSEIAALAEIDMYDDNTQVASAPEMVPEAEADYEEPVSIPRGPAEGQQPINVLGSDAVSPGYDYEGQQNYQRGRKRRSRGRAVVIGLVTLALLAGVGGFLYYRFWLEHQEQEQIAYEEVHEAHPVRVSIFAPNYTSAATRIPLHVTGTDLDGTPVDEIVYVTADGRGISLKKGNYTISAAASPLLADGTIYEVPATTVNVNIDDSVGVAEEIEVLDPTISYASGDPAAITNEQIESARAAALADEESKDKADTLAGAAYSRRDQAVATLQAEAAQAAEEKAELHTRLAVEFATNFYNIVYFPPEDDSQLQTLYNWKSNCLYYVAEGTTLYRSINNATDGVGYHGVDMIVRTCNVTAADGDKATVEVVTVSTINPVRGWSVNGGTSINTITLTFDENDKITAITH